MTPLSVNGLPAWICVLALALLSTLTTLGTAHAEEPPATDEAGARQTPSGPSEAGMDPAAKAVPPPSPRPAAQMDPGPAQQEATAPEPSSPERAQTPPAPKPPPEPPVVTEPVYYGASFPMGPPIEDDGSCQSEHACGPGHMCHRNRCVPSRVQGYGFPVALGHVMLGPIGSSVVHFAYEQRGKGLASLGGGVGSFLFGGFFGCRVTVDPCSRGDFLAGAVIVYTAFAIIDIAVLAKREVPDLRRTATPILFPSANGLVGGVRTEF